MSCEEKHACDHCPFCIIEEMEGALRSVVAAGEIKQPRSLAAALKQAQWRDVAPVPRPIIESCKRALERVKALRS